MRISATAKFLTAAVAAGRTVVPKVLIKKTADRSELLSTGTWIDVTDYISAKDIPTFKNDLEINLSQFSASKITLTGLGISFWDTNFFGYANFLELKVEYILSGITAEAVPIFAGWIEKKKNDFVVKRKERADTLKFNVWSYPDYADGIHASSLVAQYIDDNIDGSASSGLFLPHIQNLFVTNANVAGYVLKKGVHTISYQVTDIPEKQAQLDDGDWVTLSTGSNTLANAAGNQRVTVYARATIPASGEYSDDIIVNVQGDTFPKNWYSSISVQFLFLKLFEKAGITTLSLDTLEYNTSDGGKKISFLDVVPNDASYTNNKGAVVSGGTSMWFGVENKLFQRNMLTGAYTLKCTLTAGYIITRLDYSISHSDHIWIYCSNGNLYRFVISTSTLSAATAVGTEVGHADKMFYLFDYQSEYSIIYCDAGPNKIKRLDGSTLAVTDVATKGTVYACFGFLRLGTSPAKVWVYQQTDWQEIEYVSGSWVDNGMKGLGLTETYYAFAYHPYENRIYYYTNGATRYLKSHPTNSNTITTILSPFTASNNFDNNAAIFYSAVEYAVMIALSDKTLYLIAANAATVAGTGVQNRYGSFADHNSRLYGVDIYGRLYQYADAVALYVETADFEGLKVRGAIEKACSSFNLIYKISTTKSARVCRRSDENGDVITSGDSISLIDDNIKDISDESFYGDAYDIIKVSNGKNEVNYDGSVYDAVAFIEEAVFPLESDWIPDEILVDLAYNMYQFFSVNHKLYLIPSPTALMQYECIDGATIVHSGNMILNETGIIVSDSVDKAGRPEFKILVNP